MYLSRLSSLYSRLIAVWFIFMANSAVFAVNSEDRPFRVLALGDSLTAGYGLPAGDGFVDQMSQWINAQNLGYKITIMNAGVSGDTTTGGRSRLGWSLAGFGPEGPDLVIVALGGNDGLRGVNPKVTRRNIKAILEDLSGKGIDVFLVGMQAPPNLGPDYAQEFNAIYPELSEEYGASLYPFFLEGVAAVQSLNQPDGIHPNKEGVAIIIEKMGPYLKKVIEGQE
ncbi:arylesterase [Temperatibacter marinus]|uniref:Arylesterase n=1 Tax=Temperatibacter marinus TaxID=1456591 RepID=A0AA52EJV9_9PROT|nr:arylesterase [Temperatibacter marinus]WND03371.1 arylesterase [Temperatibacter marinus]